MSKFLLAAITAAAVAGSAAAAAAASAAPTQPAPAKPAAEPVRLDDAQMDSVSAGGLIGDINLAVVVPVQIVTVNTLAVALGDGSTANAITALLVEQNTQVVQRIRNRSR